MNRLKRELVSCNIVFESDNEYEEGRTFAFITDKFIVCVWRNNVLPTQLHLFDRKNFKQIAEQDLFPDRFWSNCWNSYIYGEEW